METTQIITETAQTTDSSLACFLISLFLLFFVILIITIVTIKTNRLLKENKANGIICRGIFKHIDGLDIPKNMDCEILLYTDRCEFRMGSMVFNLPMSKMVDISTKTEEEVRSYYAIRPLRGGVGAALFGTPGAVLGGVGKKKERIIDTYLIVTYKETESNFKRILFSVSGGRIISANNIINHFKSLNAVTRIDL